jgi:DNA-binding response OmpR family regulator
MALFFLPRRKRWGATRIGASDPGHDGPVHVLAVTHDVWIATLLARTARRGIKSDQVADCATALALTGTYDYDVIIVAGLPGQDVVDLCRCLRRGGVRCPMLGVAENSTVRDVVAALDGGADGFLVGPMDDAEFIARLQAARRRHKVGRERHESTDKTGRREPPSGSAAHRSNLAPSIGRLSS